jgi:micrococcal nuclease
VEVGVLKRLVVVLVVAFAGALFAAVPAALAQSPAAATVTRVIDGDTVEATLTTGAVVTVRLIGIDTPETKRPGVPVECGGPEASETMRQLVEGRAVTLTADPTQDAVDRYGRSLFYVDRDDGLDVGLEMIRRGWADVYVFDVDFQRLPGYQLAAEDANRANSGVYRDCESDFHFSREEELREQRRSADDFVQGYYRNVSRGYYLIAWHMLSRPVRRKLGPYATWKAGHRRSLGASVTSSQVRLSHGRAVVTITLRSRDRDACNGRIVRQRFRGTWTLAPRGGDGWVAARVRMRKVAGARPRLSKSDCPAPKPPPPVIENPPPPDCQGYSPCITPGPDVDCAGGSGNGPRYVNGPVTVTGSDPYGLDSDGDGVACES